MFLKKSPALPEDIHLVFDGIEFEEAIGTIKLAHKISRLAVSVYKGDHHIPERRAWVKYLLRQEYDRGHASLNEFGYTMRIYDSDAVTLTRRLIYIEGAFVEPYNTPRYMQKVLKFLHDKAAALPLLDPYDTPAGRIKAKASEIVTRDIVKQMSEGKAITEPLKIALPYPWQIAPRHVDNHLLSNEARDAVANLPRVALMRHRQPSLDLTKYLEITDVCIEVGIPGPIERMHALANLP